MIHFHALVEAIVPWLSAATHGLLQFGVCTLRVIFYQYINDLDFLRNKSGGKQPKGLKHVTYGRVDLYCFSHGAVLSGLSR